MKSLSSRELAAVTAVAFALLFALRMAPLDTPYWWDAAAVYVPGSRWVAAHHFAAVPGVFPSELGRGHTTLYYLLTAVVFRLFGASPAAGHLPVVCFGAMTLALTYALAARMFGRLAGAVAMTLLAVSPLFLTMSSEALPEVPLMALVAASLYAFARGRHVESALWGVAVVLTKETGVACPLALVGALALWGWRRGDLRGVLRPLLWASLPVAVLAMFFVWQRVAEGWWVLPYHADLFRERHSLVEQCLRVLRSMFTADGRAVVLVAAVALTPWRRREVDTDDDVPRWVVSSALAILCLANVVFFTKMFFLERYALMAHPGIAVLLAGALVTGARVPRAVGLAAVAVTVLLAVHGRDAGTGFESGETTFRYLRMVDAHRAVYRALDAAPTAPVVLTAWPMTYELRDPALGWVGRPYRALSVEYYRHIGRSVAVDEVITQPGLGQHRALRDEAARLGLRLTQRAQVGDAVTERWTRP